MSAAADATIASVSFEGGTLTLGDGATDSYSIGALTMNSGTLNGSGRVLITSNLAWNGGLMSGTGVTQLAPGATSTITTGSSAVGTAPTLRRTLIVPNGSTLSVERSATAANSYLYIDTTSGILQNEGTLNFTNTGNVSYTIILASSTVGSEIRNYGGTIYVNTSSSNTSSYVNNTGVLLRNINGTIKTNNSSVSSNASIWNQDSTAVISGTSYFDQGVRLISTNTLSGTVSIRSGSASNSPSLYLATGTSTISTSLVVDHLLMSSGTLTGDNIWITQKLDWRGGSITTAGSGVMYLTGGSTTAPNLISTTTAKTLNRTLQMEEGTYTNISTVSTSLTLNASGVIANLGTLNLATSTSSESITIYQGASGARLVNYGTIYIGGTGAATSSSTTFSSLPVYLASTGTIVRAVTGAGTLSISGGLNKQNSSYATPTGVTVTGTATSISGIYTRYSSTAVPLATAATFTSSVLAISPSIVPVILTTGTRSITAATATVTSGVRQIIGANVTVTFCAVCNSLMTTITVGSINYGSARTYGDTISLPTIVFNNTAGAIISGLSYSISLLNSAGVSASDSSTIAAGTYTASVSSILSAGYRLATTGNATGSLVINPKQLSIGATASSKVYDGTTTAALTLGSASGLVGAESISITGVGTFSSKTVGTAKPVSIVYSLANGTGLASNYILPNGSATASITAKALTASFVASDKTYDGSAAATVVGSSLDVVSGDAVNFNYTSAVFLNKNIGSKSVTVSGISLSGADATNYQLSASTATTSATISAKSLSVTYSTTTKTYDGSNVAEVTGALNGVIGSELVTVTAGAATFDNKNAGASKAVSVSSAALGGADSGNYVLSSSSGSSTGSITAKSLTATFSVTGKTYDGTTAAAVSGASNDLVSGDVVSFSYTTASFADANAASGKVVTVNGISLGGAAATNYSLQNTSATASGVINKAPLTMTANSAAKVLTDVDPTLSASYSGFIAGENSSALSSIAVTRAAGESAGTYTITPSAVATNYIITPVAGVFTVEPAGKLVVQIGNASTEYGTAASYSVTSAKYYDNSRGLLTLSMSNVGVNWTLTETIAGASSTAATFALGPTGSTSTSGNLVVGNHNIAASSQVKVSNNFSSMSFVSGNLVVEPKALTLIPSNLSKEYNGNTALPSNFSLAVSSPLGADAVDVSATGSFSSKNVSSTAGYNLRNVLLQGIDSANYYLNTGSTYSGTDGLITAKTITPSAVATSKIYDRSATADVTLTSSGLISSDVVNFASTSASFADKNVGAGKTVTISGIAISGADAANYVLSGTSATTLADITARSLTVVFTAENKVYDGNVSATVTGRSPDVMTGDVVSFASTTATFGDKNAGVAKAVSIAGVSLAGSDASNYQLTGSSGVAYADITAKPISVTYSASHKIYDASTSATVLGVLSGTISGDTVTASESAATFANKNVGNGKTVTITGVALDGSDASNYSLSVDTATAIANITAKPLAASFSVANKTYDGSTTASVTGTSSDIVSGDSVTISNVGANFSNKNVGTAKAVSVTGIAITGDDAANYSLSNTTASATADISAKSLTASFSVVDKIYDGTTSAVVVGSSSDMVSGDALTYTNGSTSAVYADKNVGSAKTVTVTGIVLGGADGGNYNLSSTLATTTGAITTKTISAAYTANNKVYDGTVSATVTGSSSDIVAGDTVNFSNASAEFSDKNVGTGKTVVVGGIALSGSDATNYLLSNTLTTTTADITTKTLTASFAAANKTYDGTTAATVVGTSSDVIAGDAVSITNINAVFASKDVGTGKVVSVSGVSISGADSLNYALSSTAASATADITKKSLTMTADDHLGAYGDVDPTFTARYSGFVGGDTVANSLTAVSITRASGTAVGTYAITPSASATNYEVSSVAGTFTIEQADRLVIQIAGSSSAYGGSISYSATSAKYYSSSGAALVTLSLTNVGNDWIATETVGGVSATAATFTLGIGAPTYGSSGSLAVGNYFVSPTNQIKVSNSFNSLSFGSATVGVVQKAITPSANGVSKVYDATTTISSSSIATTGSVSGDGVAVESSSGAFISKNVSASASFNLYGLTLSGPDAANYYINLNGATSLSGNGVITAKPLAVSYTASNKVYDRTTTASVSGVLSGLFAGDNVNIAGESASFSDANVGTGKVVTISSVLLSGSDAANYTVSASATTLANITPKTLTIHAVDKSMTYGDAVLPTLTYTVSGLIAGDAVSGSLATAATAYTSGLAGSGSEAGSYAITQGSIVAGDNYSINFAPASLVVSRKTLIIAARDDSKTYGSTTTNGGVVYTAGVARSTSIGFSATGLVNGDVIASLDLTSPGALTTATVSGGPYLITPSNVSGTRVNTTNYSISYANASTGLTVNPKALTITATNRSNTYGTNLGLGTTQFTSAGLVNDDSVVGVTLTHLSNAYVAATVSAGTYASGITPSAAVGSGLGNYTTTYVSGTLTVNKAPLLVTAISDAKFVGQNDTIGFSGVTYSGFVNGDNASTLDTANLSIVRTVAGNAAGNYLNSLLPSGVIANNYDVSYASGNFTIVPAQQLLIKVAPQSSSVAYGTSNSYVVTSAAYMSSDNSTIVSLTPTQLSTNRYQVVDGLGGVATFTLGPAGSLLSTSGNLKVGSYEISTSGAVTKTGSNFNELVVAGGGFSVTPKLLNIVNTSMPTKVYDGNATMNGINVTATFVAGDLLSGDTVTVTATGNFVDRHVGTGKNYSLAATISGADSANYYLSSGGLVGTDGVITQRASVSWIGPSSGSWSNPSNWEGGALPDRSNVASVTIPSAYTVTYDSVVNGPVTSTVINSGTLRFDFSSTSYVPMSITGVGSVSIVGSGPTVLTGSNSYLGDTLIAEGASLIAGSDSALGYAGVVRTASTSATSARLGTSSGVVLPSLQVIGGVTLTSDIATTGTQTYDAIALAPATGTTISLTSSSGDIRLYGTVDGSSDKTQSFNATSANGTITIADSVGSVARPQDLTVTGSRINLLADVLTAATQTYSGDVYIGNTSYVGQTPRSGFLFVAAYTPYFSYSSSRGTSTIDYLNLNPVFVRTLISMDPSVTFDGPVNDITPNTHTLLVAAIAAASTTNSVADINGAAAISFNSPVGETSPLYSLNAQTIVNKSQSDYLTSYVGTINVMDSVATYAGQTYQANLLNARASTQPGDVTFSIYDPSASIKMLIPIQTSVNSGCAGAGCGSMNLQNPNQLDRLSFYGNSSYVSAQNTIISGGVGAWSVPLLERPALGVISAPTVNNDDSSLPSYFSLLNSISSDLIVIPPGLLNTVAPYSQPWSISEGAFLSPQRAVPFDSAAAPSADNVEIGMSISIVHVCEQREGEEPHPSCSVGQ